MTVDFYASERHFIDHLAPIWHALPERGVFAVARQVEAHARRLGIEPQPLAEPRPILVASYGDQKYVSRRGRTQIARIEHGIGQAYIGVRAGNYAGGADCGAVSLFLCPNEYSASRWRAVYPRADVAVIGSPKLDTPPARRPPSQSGPVIATPLKCDPWSDLAAAMSALPTTRINVRGADLCVAHALLLGLNAAIAGNSPAATTARNGTTARAGSEIIPAPPSGPIDLSELMRLALARCTNVPSGSCQQFAKDAVQPSVWKLLSDGTHLRTLGSSIRGGSHTVAISLTTTGSVSLAIPCTTTKAAGNEPEAQPLVAVSTHFDYGAVPETRSAFGYYRRAFAELAKQFTVIGHAHPRAFKRLAPVYRGMGIEPVADLAEVMARASVYMTDNSSSLYEAATVMPVVVLNRPTYRRNVHHGLRFWEAATVGIQCDDPDELGLAVGDALADHPVRQRNREAALDVVYAYRDGKAAQRASDALMAWAGERVLVAA